MGVTKKNADSGVSGSNFYWTEKVRPKSRLAHLTRVFVLLLKPLGPIDSYAKVPKLSPLLLLDRENADLYHFVSGGRARFLRLARRPVRGGIPSCCLAARNRPATVPRGSAFLRAISSTV